MQKEIPTRVLMDNEGIEEAFKALSGKENTIVHIATHGFAFDKKELKQQHQDPPVFLSSYAALYFLLCD